MERKVSVEIPTPDIYGDGPANDTTDVFSQDVGVHCPITGVLTRQERVGVSECGSLKETAGSKHDSGAGIANGL